MTYTQKFIVKPNTKLDLSKIDCDFDGDFDDDDIEDKLKENCERLNELQELLFSGNQHSLLIVLQAMDAGGKDGVIRDVFSAFNAQGTYVTSFKQPSKLERAHDFLWRAHAATPALGEISIFNRSHYEDVLVVRVHNLVPQDVWQKRFDHINDFEKLLSDNNTHILKFFLHISKDEQLQRFEDRLNNPKKHWKISPTDYSERALWNDYQTAFEDAISKCSTEHAPWFVIPANNKAFRNLAISSIVVDYLEKLKMKFPEPEVEIAQIRTLLAAEKKSKK